MAVIKSRLFMNERPLLLLHDDALVVLRLGAPALLEAPTRPHGRSLVSSRMRAVAVAIIGGRQCRTIRYDTDLATAGK